MPPRSTSAARKGKRSTQRPLAPKPTSDPDLKTSEAYTTRPPVNSPIHPQSEDRPPQTPLGVRVSNLPASLAKLWLPAQNPQVDRATRTGNIDPSPQPTIAADTELPGLTSTSTSVNPTPCSHGASEQLITPFDSGLDATPESSGLVPVARVVSNRAIEGLRAAVQGPSWKGSPDLLATPFDSVLEPRHSPTGDVEYEHRANPLGSPQGLLSESLVPQPEHEGTRQRNNDLEVGTQPEPAEDEPDYHPNVSDLTIQAYRDKRSNWWSDGVYPDLVGGDHTSSLFNPKPQQPALASQGSSNQPPFRRSGDFDRLAYDDSGKIPSPPTSQETMRMTPADESWFAHVVRSDEYLDKLGKELRSPVPDGGHRLADFRLQMPTKTVQRLSARVSMSNADLTQQINELRAQIGMETYNRTLIGPATIDPTLLQPHKHAPAGATETLASAQNAVTGPSGNQPDPSCQFVIKRRYYPLIYPYRGDPPIMYDPQTLEAASTAARIVYKAVNGPDLNFGNPTHASLQVSSCAREVS